MEMLTATGEMAAGYPRHHPAVHLPPDRRRSVQAPESFAQSAILRAPRYRFVPSPARFFFHFRPIFIRYLRLASQEETDTQAECVSR